MVLLVVASMIGAGVYTTSGFALADLGDARLVIAAWMVGGLIAICGAVAFGQLATRMGENGGEYLYLSRMVHPMAGFIAGWISLLAGFTGAGAYAALAFEGYLLPAGIRPPWLVPGSLAIALTVVCTLMHCIRIRPGLLGQNALVVIKLSLLIIFLAIAAAKYQRWHGLDATPMQMPPDNPIWLAFATSVMWISLSYSGFNAAIYIAGESRGGGTAVARSMIFATIAVTILYLAINAVFLFGTPPELIAGQQDIAAISASWLGGDNLATLIRCLISIGLATSVSAILMAGPRVYSKMASDGLLPAIFYSAHPPPTRSVVLQGAAIILLIASTNLQSLLSYLGMTLAISAASTVALCTYRQRSYRPRTYRQFNVKGGWIVLLQSSCVCIYVLATTLVAILAAINRPVEAVAFAATILSGIAIYFILTRRG